MGSAAMAARSAHVCAIRYQAPEIIVWKLIDTNSSTSGPKPVRKIIIQTPSKELEENMNKSNTQRKFHKSKLYEIKPVSFYHQVTKNQICAIYFDLRKTFNTMTCSAPITRLRNI